jgi:predicted metal-dependent enzyme (double-stranded beta helix superfamily)
MKARPMSAEHGRALPAFVDDIDDIVREGGGETVVTERVAVRMRRLLACRDFLSPELVRPHPDRYVLYPLHVDPQGRFPVAAAVWGVGQATPIHDHQTWGVIGIYSGVEGESRFEPAHDGLAALGSNRFEAGDVSICCTTDRDLHAVGCSSDIACVGIHVYGADIGTITRYAYDSETGERNAFVSTWATPS